jgi:hypothetical protein
MLLWQSVRDISAQRPAQQARQESIGDIHAIRADRESAEHFGSR